MIQGLLDRISKNFMQQKLLKEMSTKDKDFIAFEDLTTRSIQLISEKFSNIQDSTRF